MAGVVDVGAGASGVGGKEKNLGSDTSSSAPLVFAAALSTLKTGTLDSKGTCTMRKQGFKAGQAGSGFKAVKAVLDNVDASEATQAMHAHQTRNRDRKALLLLLFQTGT